MQIIKNVVLDVVDPLSSEVVGCVVSDKYFFKLLLFDQEGNTRTVLFWDKKEKQAGIGFKAD